MFTGKSARTAPAEPSWLRPTEIVDTDVASRAGRHPFVKGPYFTKREVPFHAMRW